MATLVALSATNATAATSAESGSILGADRSTAIAGKYIVALKDTAQLRSEGSGEVVARLAAKYKSTVGHHYRTALSGYSAELSEESARKLAADPAVAYVEQDSRVQASGSDSDSDSEVGVTQIREGATWGLDRIDQRAPTLNGRYSFTDTGAGVRVYVLDTGIRTSHNEFQDANGVSRASAPRDIVDDDFNAADCNGHGTHVAGTAVGKSLGVASEARVVGVRVLDCDGEGTASDLIAGFDYVAANGIRPAVVNVSLGGQASAAIDSAAQRLLDLGFTVVAAAGNTGDLASEFSPARVTGVLTVAASDVYDQRPYWSNYGAQVDVHAPGVAVLSAGHNSNTATVTKSGTSMAAPHVAGVAARYLQTFPDKTAGNVSSAINRNVNPGAITLGPPPPPGWDPVSPLPDPENPPPRENAVPATEPSFDHLLHASVWGQPDTTCVLTGLALGKPIADGPGQAGTLSPLLITGCGQTSFWGPVKVEFNIDHPRPSDLLIDLVAPDEQRYRLRDPGTSTPVNNVTAWPKVTELRNGTWKLDVIDQVSGQQGSLSSWKILF
ncbi:S8 family serine peptidase [Streptomyces sp. NPDC088748]|uniref:S8 family peptidase n=1 Tax=Streptomyces sp. NPDC088748 TaxID=3365887 RepID=UPI0037F498B6